MSSSTSDDQGTPSESSRVPVTKAKNVKNAKTNFMWKNCSNKKTPQVSKIQSKKLRPVDNNVSPDTPPIEFPICFVMMTLLML